MMRKTALALLWTLLPACQYAKPACTVISVADKVCMFLVVKNPDGTESRVAVHPEELQRFAYEVQRKRLAGQ